MVRPMNCSGPMPKKRLAASRISVDACTPSATRSGGWIAWRATLPKTFPTTSARAAPAPKHDRRTPHRLDPVRLDHRLAHGMLDDETRAAEAADTVADDAGRIDGRRVQPGLQHDGIARHARRRAADELVVGDAE